MCLLLRFSPELSLKHSLPDIIPTLNHRCHLSSLAGHLQAVIMHMGHLAICIAVLAYTKQCSFCSAGLGLAELDHAICHHKSKIGLGCIIQGCIFT